VLRYLLLFCFVCVFVCLLVDRPWAHLYLFAVVTMTDNDSDFLFNALCDTCFVVASRRATGHLNIRRTRNSVTILIWNVALKAQISYLATTSNCTTSYTTTSNRFVPAMTMNALFVAFVFCLLDLRMIIPRGVAFLCVEMPAVHENEHMTLTHYLYVHTTINCVGGMAACGSQPAWK
jgi:hypothetical protein